LEANLSQGLNNQKFNFIQNLTAGLTDEIKR
jgi:hypothetical protein